MSSVLVGENSKIDKRNIEKTETTTMNPTENHTKGKDPTRKEENVDTSEGCYAHGYITMAAGVILGRRESTSGPTRRYTTEARKRRLRPVRENGGRTLGRIGIRVTRIGPHVTSPARVLCDRRADLGGWGARKAGGQTGGDGEARGQRTHPGDKLLNTVTTKLRLRPGRDWRPTDRQEVSAAHCKLDNGYNTTKRVQYDLSFVSDSNRDRGLVWRVKSVNVVVFSFRQNLLSSFELYLMKFIHLWLKIFFY